MSVTRRNSKRRKSTQRKSLRRGIKKRYVGGDTIIITKNNNVDKLRQYVGYEYSLFEITKTKKQVTDSNKYEIMEKWTINSNSVVRVDTKPIRSDYEIEDSLPLVILIETKFIRYGIVGEHRQDYIDELARIVKTAERDFVIHINTN